MRHDVAILASRKERLPCEFTFDYNYLIAVSQRPSLSVSIIYISNSNAHIAEGKYCVVPLATSLLTLASFTIPCEFTIDYNYPIAVSQRTSLSVSIIYISNSNAPISEAIFALSR